MAVRFRALYRTSILSCAWARYISQDISADANYVRGKAAMVSGHDKTNILCLIFEKSRVQLSVRPQLSPGCTKSFQENNRILPHITAVAQWLRCCATNRKVAGSIPDESLEFFIDIKSFRSHYGPGVNSASNRNEYQEYFLGVKAAGA